MEHIVQICSLESELFLISIGSIRNRSRNRDIFKKRFSQQKYFRVVTTIQLMSMRSVPVSQPVARSSRSKLLAFLP